MQNNARNSRLLFYDRKTVFYEDFMHTFSAHLYTTAIFKACDGLESYDLASLLADLFLLADSQPTRYFCSPFLPIGYRRFVCW